MSGEQIWLIVGFIGQTIFASRFLIQWVVSERASKSIIPNIFWWISLAGSMVLLSYAIHKVDPVFIVITRGKHRTFLLNRIVCRGDGIWTVHALEFPCLRC